MTAPAQPRRRKDFGVGARLRQLREQAGLSQTELAHRLGWAPSRISHIERGTYDPTLSTLKRYCDAVGARIHIGPDDQAHTKEER